MIELGRQGQACTAPVLPAAEDVPLRRRCSTYTPDMSEVLYVVVLVAAFVLVAGGGLFLLRRLFRAQEPQ